MDRVAIETELRRLVREARKDKTLADPGTAGAGLEDTIDSLEGVELILAAETFFGVSIPDRDLNRICRSIAKVAEEIERKLDAKARRAEKEVK